MLTVTATSAALAQRGPFIYFLHAPDLSCLYIGQTAGATGPLGRLVQHLSETGSSSFLTRARQFFPGVDGFSVGGVEFAAFQLPAREEFSGRARDYREAVEWLVQQDVIRKITERRWVLPVVSFVRPNGYTSTAFVEEVAAMASRTAIDWLERSVSATES